MMGLRIFVSILFIKNPVVMIQINMIYEVIRVLITFSLLKKNNMLARIWYSPARVRDGKYGRYNYLISMCATLLQLLILGPILLYLISINRLPLETFYLLIGFMYMPLLVGDMCGELFGSIWGKQSIRVIGVGEINCKSWLGTWATFLGAALSLPVYILLFTTYSLSLALIFQIIIISFVCTVVEILSPRSTDNFFIPASSLLVYFCFFL